jgi:predicted DNA-binding transcriptional regulator AlpA
MGKFLRIEQVAERVGAAKNTIKKWAPNGTHGCPPGFKIGRARVWDEDVVEAWALSDVTDNVREAVPTKTKK